MDSLRRYSVSFYFFFLFAAAAGNDPWRLPAGAAEAGMGYACIARSSFWSSFHNQANLAYNNSLSAGFNYENRFGIPELSPRSAGLTIPAGKASIGAIYSYSGHADFRRHNAGLACGLMLSGKLAAGAQVDYFSEMTFGEYDDHHSLSFEIGMLFTPVENVIIGFHLFNPLPHELSSPLLPSRLRAGTGINLSKSLFAAAEFEMSTVSPLLLRTGFEYEAFKKMWLRGGFCTENTSFSFGLGYKLDFVQLDIGFVTHDKLGVTSSASLIFKIK